MSDQIKTVRVLTTGMNQHPTVNIRTSGDRTHPTHAQSAVGGNALKTVQPNTGADSRQFKTIIIPGYVGPA